MPRVKKIKEQSIEANSLPENTSGEVSFPSQEKKLKDCCQECGVCDKCIHPAGNIRNYTPLLVLLLIIASFLLGALITKVTWLQSNGTSGTGTTAGTTTGQQPGTAPKPLHVAKSLGMDEDKFKKCLESGKYADQVAKDLADGQTAGVSGTPAVFVNGMLIVGAQPYSVFKEAIDKELASARNTTPLFEQLSNALVGEAYAQSPSEVVTPSPIVRVDVALGTLEPMGNNDAKVTLIEFADFQCPYCKKFHDEVGKTLVKEYVKTGKAKFIFRNYAFLGQESNAAAEGAFCANEQGKFWPYHDFLYDNQGPENAGHFTKENLY